MFCLHSAKPSVFADIQLMCVINLYIWIFVISALGNGLFHDTVPSDPQKRKEVWCLTRPFLKGGDLVLYGTYSGGQLLLLYLTSTIGQPLFPLFPTLHLTILYRLQSWSVSFPLFLPHLLICQRDPGTERNERTNSPWGLWLSPSPLEPLFYAWTN